MLRCCASSHFWERSLRKAWNLYDPHVAHFFVQGCDAWLNNPIEPMEACGTSGMKAGIKGVPHLSVADGWWVEHRLPRVAH